VFGKRLAVLGAAVGALPVTRGQTIWLLFSQGALGTPLVIVLAGIGIVIQGGLSGGRKTAG